MRIIQGLIFIAMMLSLTACQLGGYQHNIRTPHLPVFTSVTPGQAHDSNIYWNRFTSYFDRQTLKLSSGKTYEVEYPTLIGALGTHYRFRNDVYLFGMTGGLGAQYDILFWNSGKLSVSFLSGFNQNIGGQISIAQEVGEIFNGKVTLYLSLQRREIVIAIDCISSIYNQCVAGDTTGKNNIVVREDVFNALVGLQFGRFRLGDKGNTTLNFRAEYGLNQVLSSKVEGEDHPSEFTHSKYASMLALHLGLTLW